MRFTSAPLALGPLLLGLVLYRTLDALLVQTYFNPDEYWQGPEVAHQMAFGYGHLTWEWQPGARIRGFSHPLLFATVYRLLALCGLDSRDVVAAAPRILQAVLAAVADLYTYRLGRRFFGEVAGKWALFASLVNWFVFYCMVRTFSNSTEASLATVAFYYWPWREPVDGIGPFSGLQTAVVFGSLAFIMRPSSGVLWAWLGAQHLWTLYRSRGMLAIFYCLLECATIGLTFVGASVCIDRIFYGVWTFVPLNFLRFNAVSGGSRLYGVNAHLYYFIEAYPVMLLSLLPFVCMGIAWASGTHQRRPAQLVAVVTIVYSLTAHKEYRFVLPVLPLLLVYAGHALATLQPRDPKPKTKRSVKDAASPPSASLPTLSPGNWTYLLGFVVALQAGLGAYLSLVHQRAPISVMQLLSSQADRGEIESVGMLMGCHSTPHYSLFHTTRETPLLFLDCSPHALASAESAATAGLTLDYTQSAAFNRAPLRFVIDYFSAAAAERPPHAMALENNCAGIEKRHTCLAQPWCAWYNCSALEGTIPGVCTELHLHQPDAVAHCIDGWPEKVIMEWSNVALVGPETANDDRGVWRFDGLRGAEGGVWEMEEEEWSLQWREARHLGALPPSHVVLFDRTAPRILPFLSHFGYTRRHRLAHALVSDEGSFMEVWCRLPAREDT